MTIKELKEKNLKIFNEKVIQNFDFLFVEYDVQTITDILNVLFYNRYYLQTINDYKTQDEIDIIVSNILYKNKVYYQAVTDSLTTEFDVLSPIKMTSTDDSNKNGTNNVESTMSDDTQTNDTNTNTSYSRTYDDNTLTEIEKTTEVVDNHTVTTGTQNNDTTYNETNKVTSTKTGYYAINFNEAMKTIYETKKINLFDIIMSDVKNDILIPLYDVDVIYE